MLGKDCAASCLTRDHASWGECIRSQNQKIAYCRSAHGHDRTLQKGWDSDLDAYKQARSEGIQPASTRRRDVTDALRISDHLGGAFQAE